MDSGARYDEQAPNMRLKLTRDVKLSVFIKNTPDKMAHCIILSAFKENALII
jgi:hypothetical protein